MKKLVLGLALLVGVFASAQVDIKIEGNYLTLEDTDCVSCKKLFHPAKDVTFEILVDNRIKFVKLSTNKAILSTPLSDLEMDALDPLFDASGTDAIFDDLAEFEAWMRTNTGFNTALGGSGVVNVKDYGAKGDGVTDDTEAIIAATANNRPVFFPAGVYLYSGGAATLDKQWYGEGYGNVYNSNASDNVTIIKCTGNNSGNPFLDNLRVLENIHLDGIDNTGIALELGQDGTYKSFYNWKNVVVRRFEVGIDVYNGFSNNLQNIYIQGNNKGIRATPTAGTFNANDWSNIHIADNTDYGVLVDVPNITQVWQITNMVIERNGSSGTFQSSFENVRANFDGLYVEDSNTIPGIKWNGGVLNITTGLFSNSGGIDLSSVDTMLKLENSDFLGATDLIANISSGTDIYVLNSELEQNDLRTVGANVSLINTLYDGTTYNYTKSFSVNGDLSANTVTAGTIQSGTAIVLNDVNSSDRFLRVLNTNAFSTSVASSLYQLGRTNSIIASPSGTALTRLGIATNGLRVSNSAFGSMLPPTEMLDVGGNIKTDALVLTSPDGTIYEVTVANGGTLTVTAQ